MNSEYNMNELESAVSPVVRLINDEFSSDATAERQAADYAYEGAKQGGYGINKENLEAHLDTLREEGAKFDYAEALRLALEE